MKKIILTSLMLVSQLSLAGIANSQLENRHQALIEKAIDEKCGRMLTIEQQSNEVEVIRVDQGIQDAKFKTVFTALDRIDQGVFNEYSIIVESAYYDSYDHNEKDWGIYQVESVKCEMK